MGRRRTSPIWLMGKKEFQKIVNESGSIRDILRKIGLGIYGGNHRTVEKRILEDSIDLTKFNKNKQEHFIVHGKRQRIPDSEIFVENSTYTNRTNIKKRIVEQNLLEYKCSECDVMDEYNNKPLVLQLDHINGIPNDHRLENLRFLCPNCHSQTDTYAGKSS